MKLIRKAQNCDIEMDMTPGFNGEFLYSIDIVQDGNQSYCQSVPQEEAFGKLVELFGNPSIRVPSKYVIEFAKYVITDLCKKLEKTQRQGGNIAESILVASTSGEVQ